MFHIQLNFRTCHGSCILDANLSMIRLGACGLNNHKLKELFVGDFSATKVLSLL